MKKIFKVAILVLMIFSVGIFAGASTPSNNGETIAYAAVISQGNTGSTVKTIQRKLKNWGYYKGAVDGIFGPKTKEAVKYFQRKNNEHHY